MTVESSDKTILEQGGVRLLQRDSVAEIRIEREARRNSLDNPALEAIIAAVGLLPTLQVPVCIISSQGTKAFCAGSDLKALVEYELAQKIRHTRLFQRAMAAIDEAPCATIAAIEGFCLGGGLELALGCDRRIASAEASFGFPEIGVGALPTGGGTLRAPRAIGLARARDMLVFGERIDAAIAHNFGLVSQVCPAGEARALAWSMAEVYASRASARSVSLLKGLILGGLGAPDRSTHLIAELSDEILLATADSQQKMTEGAQSRSK